MGIVVMHVLGMVLGALVIAAMVMIGTMDFNGGWDWLAALALLMFPLMAWMNRGEIIATIQGKGVGVEHILYFVTGVVVSAAMAWNLSHFWFETPSVSSLPVPLKVTYGILSGALGIGCFWKDFRYSIQVIRATR